MLTVKAETPAHTADGGPRHANIVDAISFNFQQCVNCQQLQAQSIDARVIHHVDRDERAFIEHAERIGHVKHATGWNHLDIPAIRAAISLGSGVAIAGQPKAEPLERQAISRMYIWLICIKTQIAKNAAQCMPYSALIASAQPVTERINSPNVLDSTLKPLQNYKTERLTHLVVGQAQSAKARAILRMLRYIRRQESG